MAKEKLLVLEDAVIIEREPSRNLTASTDSAISRCTRRRSANQKEPGRRQTDARQEGEIPAVGGGIGLLAGAFLGGPSACAVGAASIGAIAAAMKDFGIDDTSIAAIKQSLQPNTSALLLLGHANDRDALLAKLREFDAKVVMTSLDPEVERELLERLEGQA